MSYLAQAKKAEPKSPMLTIVGAPGTGKTTLGAMFPAPIFMCAEDGSAVFENWDSDAAPTLLPAIPKSQKGASTIETVRAQMRELLTAPHDYKTLVIDSITSLNVMLEAEIALRDGVGNVADAAGGYHKGYIELSQWHADIIYMCNVLRHRKEMAVIFLAHQGIDKVKNRPDDASQYSVYGIDMHRDSSALYVSQSDAVLYIKHDEFVTGQETNRKGQTTKYGRIVQSGERKIITSGDGLTGYVSAKNRYQMDNEIPLPLGENPILKYIKFFNATKGE